MKLVIGLGNPGPKYKNTRHNFGALFVFFFSKYLGIEFREKKRVLSEVAETKIGTEKILLAKPLTFMNLSGEAVSKLMKFYKVKLSDVIVVHDELDLPLGVIRIKRGGGTAGNNGLESVVMSAGDNFWRLRLGIGKPAYKGSVPKYVLSPFEVKEKHVVQRVVELGVKHLEKSLLEGLENTTLK